MRWGIGLGRGYCLLSEEFGRVWAGGDMAGFRLLFVVFLIRHLHYFSTSSTPIIRWFSSGRILESARTWTTG